jgi:molecular chaperone HscB
VASLQSNDFELFELPTHFAQNRAVIDARWKDLQREAHPDKFAAQGAAEQRLALQWSVRINEAYQRLKDPQKRAAYLCELQGVPIAAHTNTAMPGEFLMLQMSWREALDDASAVDELEAIGAQALAYKKTALEKIESSIDVAHDYAAAAAEVRGLMFVEKFLTEVHARIEQAENAAAAADAGKGQ